MENERDMPVEIEITEEMIEAGESVVERYGPYQDSRVLALMVYTAMESARCLVRRKAMRSRHFAQTLLRL